MLQFSDLLYGRVALPEWIAPFLRLPEFVRLRAVRLSNVDSFEFKDFSNATRWEHGVAVAYLATRCGERRGLSVAKAAELTLAALLHDVATPPFGHTAEYVLDNFDHELETERVLAAVPSENSTPDIPVFGSSLPQFRREVGTLTRHYHIRVDPDEIARMVTGGSELGFLIAGTLDLDNADNVTRGCLQLGIDVDREVPLRIADWLATRNSAPTDLVSEDNPAVQSWLRYRSEYHAAFFGASEEEHGRQAFLQHIMRRALKAGLPRRTLIWNTDDGLFERLVALEGDVVRAGRTSLQELVERYRLLESPTTVLRLEIQDEETLRILRLPQVSRWIEDILSSREFEPFVFVSARRFAQAPLNQSLFPPSPGMLYVFKLGSAVTTQQLPAWLKSQLSANLVGARLRNRMAGVISREIPKWVAARPWLSVTSESRESLIENLKSFGDWSFRLSRNESLHPYPSTFVHAIPAALINALGLKGELILDPFGGTGQTVAEAIKYDGSGITADSNLIATLAARARLSPLSREQRDCLSTIAEDMLRAVQPVPPPDYELREKWHHPRTLAELCKIRSFIDGIDDAIMQQFLLACFSAVIPNTTGRRGKQHGFFADNTPLSKDLGKPPYQDAIESFVARIRRNLDILARFYAFLERKGREPLKELARATVLRLDARRASPADYGVTPGSVAGIITSPPYLCMADYTLGQRLSYYWIAPDALEQDFKTEISARRRRFNPKKATADYFESMECFASSATRLLRSGGFLATVLGEPAARAFRSSKVLRSVDEIFQAAGLRMVWHQWRPIHWHRNQGYQRLLKERVAVHVRS
jgi:hypothetical protein